MPRGEREGRGVFSSLFFVSLRQQVLLRDLFLAYPAHVESHHVPPGVVVHFCVEFEGFLPAAEKRRWEKFQWGLCAWRHGIQISTEAFLACHPALSTEWLDWVAQWCELWRMRTGSIIPRKHNRRTSFFFAIIRFSPSSLQWQYKGNNQQTKNKKVLCLFFMQSQQLCLLPAGNNTGITDYLCHSLEANLEKKMLASR